MPIRTHRGRAAVYRTVWGWPLRSPRHLVAVVMALVAIGAGVAVALPGDGRSGSPVTTGASNTERANAFDPASRSAIPSASPGNDFERQATERARSVADAWVRAYLTTPDGMISDRWVEQLRPHTAAALLPELRTVDPANVPDARITGPPRTISATDTSARFDVPTSALVLRVELTATPEGWRVSGYERAG